ncbi:MAG: filamentous hemagglutinin N-terminal domain-containing protein [Alteromonadales bacterium]|nr:filamentous hemagglutinin N-terminal domain-containing protein [Alteromonadales bacterium]
MKQGAGEVKFRNEGKKDNLVNFSQLTLAIRNAILASVIASPAVGVYANTGGITAETSSVVVSEASNGAVVVDIAAPFNSGLSYNRFQDYNVSEKGVVLNNSTISGESVIAGELDANSNLTFYPANMIVAEVVGSDISELNGQQEIFGRKADFMLANPNGVVVNGVGFVNTNNVTLAVGSPLISSNGYVSGSSTRSADADALLEVFGEVEGANVLSLFAPKIHIGEEADILVTNNINVAAGQFDFYDYYGAYINQVDNDEKSIDAVVFGAMKANNINIISNGAGVGVNVNANLNSRNGVFISSSGDLEVAGDHLVERSVIDDVLENNPQPLLHQAVYMSKGDLNAHDLNVDTIDGAMISSEGSAMVKDASLVATSIGDVEIDTINDLSLEGVEIQGANNADIKSSEGSISAVDVNVVVDREVDMIARGDLTLNNFSSESLRRNDGSVEDNQKKATFVSLAGNLNAIDSTIKTSTAEFVSVDGSSTLNNTDIENNALIEGKNEISLNGSTHVSGDAIVNSRQAGVSLDGDINIEGQGLFRANGDINQSGNISGARLTTEAAGSTVLNGTINTAEFASISSEETLTLKGNVTSDQILLNGKKGVTLERNTSAEANSYLQVIAPEGTVSLTGHVSGNQPVYSSLKSGDILSIQAQDLTLNVGEIDSEGKMLLDIDGNVSLTTQVGNNSGSRHYSHSETEDNKDCDGAHLFNLFGIFAHCSNIEKKVETEVRWRKTEHLPSRINAGGDLSIVNANNINITGSDLTSDGDGVYFTDEGSINILNQTNWFHEDVKEVTHRTSHQRDQVITDVQTTNRSSSSPSLVASKQNLRLVSADDINITGSQVLAGGQLILAAVNDVIIQSAQNTLSRVLNREGETNMLKFGGVGFFGLGLEFSHTRDEATMTQQGTLHSPSVIKGGQVIISSGDPNLREQNPDQQLSNGDVTIQGSLVESRSSIFVNAAGSIFNKAAYNRVSTNLDYKRNTSTFGIGLGSISFGGDNAEVQRTSSELFPRISQLKAERDIILKAEKDIHDEGGNYESEEGAINLTAREIISKAAKRSVEEHSKLTANSWKATLGFDITVGGQRLLQSWDRFLKSVVSIAKPKEERAKPLNNQQRLNLTLGEDIEPEFETERSGFNDLSIPVVTLPSDSNPLGLNIGFSFDTSNMQAEFSRQVEGEIAGNIKGDSVSLVALEGDIKLHGNVIEADNGDVIIQAANGNVYYLPVELKQATQSSQQINTLGFNFGITLTPNPSTGISFGGGFGIDASHSNYKGEFEREQEVAGSVTALENAQITAANGSIKIVGTNIEAGGDVILQALNNIDIDHVATTIKQYQDANAVSGEFNIGFSSAPPFLTSFGVKVQAGADNLSQTANVHEEATLTAGNDVIIDTESGNITLVGTNITAGNDVSLTAPQGTVNIEDSVDSATLDATSIGGGFNFNWSAPLTLGAGFNIKNNSHEINAESADTSLISAGNDVTLAGGNGITLVGADIDGGGKVTLDGGIGNINFLASQTDSSENVSVNQFGFGFGNLTLQGQPDNGAILPSFNLDLDFQQLNVQEHIEKGGSVTGGEVEITTESALNLEGTVITASNGAPSVDVGSINATAAVSTVQGSGLGFQLGLGVPSYTVSNKPQQLLPNLPSFETGFQAYHVDKQTVTNASINGQEINPSTLPEKDTEIGVDFGFGVDFSNANAVKGEAGSASGGNNQIANAAFGAAAIATILTDTEAHFNVGAFKPSFGWELPPNFSLIPGTFVESIIDREIEGIEFIQVEDE